MLPRTFWSTTSTRDAARVVTGFSTSSSPHPSGGGGGGAACGERPASAVAHLKREEQQQQHSPGSSPAHPRVRLPHGRALLSGLPFPARSRGVGAGGVVWGLLACGHPVRCPSDSPFGACATRSHPTGPPGSGPARARDSGLRFRLRLRDAPAPAPRHHPVPRGDLVSRSDRPTSRCTGPSRTPHPPPPPTPRTRSRGANEGRSAVGAETGTHGHPQNMLGSTRQVRHG